MKRRKCQNACDTAPDIQRVPEDSVRIGIKGAAEHLAKPNEHQRNKIKNKAAINSTRNDKLGHIGVECFGPKKTSWA